MLKSTSEALSHEWQNVVRIKTLIHKMFGKTLLIENRHIQTVVLTRLWTHWSHACAQTRAHLYCWWWRGTWLMKSFEQKYSMARQNVFYHECTELIPRHRACRHTGRKTRLACRVLLSVYLLAGELAEQSEKGLCCLAPDGPLFSQSHTLLRISCGSNWVTHASHRVLISFQTLCLNYSKKEQEHTHKDPPTYTVLYSACSIKVL